MNENKFQSNRNHTRVQFEPLTISCQLYSLNPASPAAQSHVTGGAPEFIPDRTATPAVIVPEVRAIDPDNIFPKGSVNALLDTASLRWYVNGEAIEDVWTSGVDYEIITTATDLRGALKVYKNIPPSEKAVLQFKGQFLDWRTNVIYNAESKNELALTSTERGADKIACSVDVPQFVYDPLFDDLLLYDYKVARGIPVTGQREDYINGKCYLHSVNVNLTIGTEAQDTLPTGVTMVVAKTGTSSALTPASDASPELLSATYPTVTFDMRMIAKGDYDIRFMREGSVIAQCTTGMHTSVTMPSSGGGLFKTDLIPAMKVWNNRAYLNLADREVPYPECYYLLHWFTQAQKKVNGVWQYDTEKAWQYGEAVQVKVSDLGIGNTASDSFFDFWLTADPHPTRSLTEDEEHNVLVDENGDYLID